MRNLFWILALSVLVLGCDQGQKMLEPVTHKPAILVEEPSADLSPVEEIEFTVDGVIHTADAFTSAEAALKSQQFQDFLKYAREYNEEWCGQLEKVFGEDIGNIDLFKFTSEEAADAFLTQAPKLYPNDIKPTWAPKLNATDYRAWWGISLSPRCQ